MVIQKKDVNKENKEKTCEILRIKIFQIDEYFNERRTIFYNYLNKAKGELKKIKKQMILNRSILNIFYLANQDQENQDL